MLARALTLGQLAAVALQYVLRAGLPVAVEPLHFDGSTVTLKAFEDALGWLTKVRPPVPDLRHAAPPHAELSSCFPSSSSAYL